MHVCLYAYMWYVDIYGWHVETALRARTHAHVMRRVFSSACTPAPACVFVTPLLRSVPSATHTPLQTQVESENQLLKVKNAHLLNLLTVLLAVCCFCRVSCWVFVW